MKLKGLLYQKSCSGTFLFIGGIVFALIGFLVGWAAWGWRTGLVIAVVIVGAFLAASVITFMTIENPSAVAASLPLALSLVYNVMPDIPGPVDDTLVQLIGSALTFFMWKRRDDRFPTWAIAPLAAAAGYALIGGFIPGPFDELLVNLVSISIVVYQYRKNMNQDPKQPEAESGEDKTGSEGEAGSDGKISDIADETPPALPEL